MTYVVLSGALRFVVGWTLDAVRRGTARTRPARAFPPARPPAPLTTKFDTAGVKCGFPAAPRPAPAIGGIDPRPGLDQSVRPARAIEPWVRTLYAPNGRNAAFPGMLAVYLAASRPAQARATVANVCQKISEGPYRVGVGGAVQAGCALTVRNRPLG